VTVLAPLVRETGATLLVLDHTGNPVPFTKRSGVYAPRGASAKGQKFDALLEFRSVGPGEFTITVGKMRAGGSRPAPARFRVADGEDGTLELLASADAEAVEEIADAVVEAIEAAGMLITKDLRASLKGRAGAQAITRATEFLEAEEPRRVVANYKIVETTGRKTTRQGLEAGVVRVFRGVFAGYSEQP
jgi:hypothetical protein